MTRCENVGVLIWEKVWLENSRANRKEGDRVGVGSGTEQVVKGNNPHGGHGRVCEGEWPVSG